MDNCGKKIKRIKLNIAGEEITYIFSTDYQYSNTEGCHTITFGGDREQFDEAVPNENGCLLYNTDGIPIFWVSDSGAVYKME